MVVTRSQAQILINKFSNISINKQVQMASPVVNYVLSPFKGHINPWDPQGLKLYLQATKEIYKEPDKLDISVSNVNDIIDHFLGLSNKYGCVRLEFMLENDVGENNIFRQVEQIQIADMYHQAHGYFRLLGIGNVGNNVLPNPLVVSALKKLAGSAQQVNYFWQGAVRYNSQGNWGFNNKEIS